MVSTKGIGTLSIKELRYLCTLNTFWELLSLSKNPKRILKMQKKSLKKSESISKLGTREVELESLVASIKLTSTFTALSAPLGKKAPYGNLFPLPKTQGTRSCSTRRVYLRR